MRSPWFILLLLSFLVYPSGAIAMNTDDLRITLPTSDSQEFILSDGNQTHYTMETTKKEKRKWHGMVQQDKNYITNLWFRDGQENLDETNIEKTDVYPDHVVYTYDNGATEQLFMPDDLGSLVIEYHGISTPIKVTPTYAMRTDFYSSSGISDYTVSSDADGTIYITTLDTQYIALVASVNGTFNDLRQLKGRYFSRDHDRKDGSSFENLFAPGYIEYQTNNLIFVASIAKTKEEAKQKGKSILTDLVSLKEKKLSRLQSIIDKLGFSATMKYNGQILDLTHSMNQALLSIDKLKMNRFGEGTYAGLHWFDDYWGRDTFISIYGASLVLGDWDFAKATIKTMADMQLNDSSIYEFGRVPNRVVDVANPDYTTADGTGWFVKAIGDYIKLSKDYTFAEQIYPNMVLAIEGEKSRIKDGLVTHEARGTWMDAMTSGIIQTPRDDRAVEIQALLYQMYSSTIFVGELLGRDVSEYILAKDALKSRIYDGYYDNSTGLLADHLNSDGTRDIQIRPNQYLALALLPDDFLNVEQLSRLINASSSLITSYGIRTLDPSDPQYKGSHDGGWWHHDVAYHNGDIWPWLSGAVLDLLYDSHHYDLLRDLIHNLYVHTLQKNPVGGIGEVFDGDSVGDGESVGALLQLWSLAEYIRSLTQISHGFTFENNTIFINARGLKVFDSYATNVLYNDSSIRYVAIHDQYGYNISIQNVPETISEIVISVPKLDGVISSPNFAIIGDKMVFKLPNLGAINLQVDVKNRPHSTSNTITTSSLNSLTTQNKSPLAFFSSLLAIFIRSKRNKK